LNTSEYSFVQKYYKNRTVAEEIYYFSRRRWLAVHCSESDPKGRPIIIRYLWGKPLTLRDSSDLHRIFHALNAFKPRTVYVSVNLYRRIRFREDVLDYLNNVYLRTPSWDIDSELNWWRHTLEVARAIVDVLEKHGVVKSVYLIWSGRGVHVHIHERAISSSVLKKYHPIDVTYSIVEYVIGRVKSFLNELNINKGTRIKVENLMDPQRVFTAPLSLHKKLNVSCIAFKPEEIDSFDLSWINPENFKHNLKWRLYEVGEADELALKAFQTIGPYPKPYGSGRRRRHKPLDEAIRKYLPKDDML